MARISSVRKPNFDLKAPLCRPSRQAVGRRRQLLCSHDHEVLLGRKASKDLLATHHKKELEGYRHLGRTVDQRLQMRVLLQALLL
jgi:CRISPR/Cas system-associated protein Cas10 (large subunit of type III CRISPR-Cas system)